MEHHFLDLLSYIAHCYRSIYSRKIQNTLLLLPSYQKLNLTKTQHQLYFPNDFEKMVPLFP